MFHDDLPRGSKQHFWVTCVLIELKEMWAERFNGVVGAGEIFLAMDLKEARFDHFFWIFGKLFGKVGNREVEPKINDTSISTSF